MQPIARTIVPCGHVTLGYAELLLKDIKPDRFARMVRIDGKPINSIHPAFAFGHLSIYPEKLMGMLDREPGDAKSPEGFAEVFAAGQDCKDDPEGTIYPPMQNVVDHFFKGHRVLLAALEEASDDLLLQENPMEGDMKTRFPTKGTMFAFTLSAHTMMHLGQVSFWRRCMGLGPVM
ncbi:MAG: hypothetical protein JJU33_06995 [Phycisphaerales bacterium]|nr:hypothetical protein [Phycisphaerales bacterium]